MLTFSEDKILSMLEAMGGVRIVHNKNQKCSFLVKNEVKFGRIEKDGCFLINPNSRNLKKVSNTILNCPDQFLQAATKAYWAGSQKVQNR